jgi:hypothetical protein
VIRGCTTLAVVAVTLACVAEDDDGDDDAHADTGTTEGTAEPTTNDPVEEPPSCIAAQQAADEFIANNSACEVDEDCASVLGLCVSSNVCGQVSLAVGYDAAAWAMIDAGLQTCMECGGDPCPGCSVCDDGICRAAFAECG